MTGVQTCALPIYASIAGLGKPVSKLVLGVDNQFDLESSRPFFDDYLERGGNAFDTAFVYGGGQCETLLGTYLERQNLRDGVVILGKGAHTPNCDPAAIGTQLTVSLERLRTDFVDVYMMHRDNPDVPVGEFIDALNAQQALGRMRVFGVSNWSLERMIAANQYAAAHGLHGITVASNQFSLAKMLSPIWSGCVPGNEPAQLSWLKSEGVALMPWSSQARGFFVAGDANDTSNPELVRCWYDKDNFQRLERAKALAGVLGVETINVALAYVLHQPFATFPPIGPRSVSETASSFRALEIHLEPPEVAWLNLETHKVPPRVATRG